jgi:predicted O-methyltransferase YrrM
MNNVYEYIKYILKAKGRHGIHSPFVYDFTDSCLSIPISKNDQKTIQSFSNKLSTNKTEIQQIDLGSGSKKKGVKTIQTIYNNARSKGSYAKLLYQINKHYQGKEILELGTNLGIGTLHLYLGNKNSSITSVEGCPNLHTFTKHNFELFENHKIKFIHSSFIDFLDKNNKVFDIVYIDGDHHGESLEKYIELLHPFTHNETIYLIDDIRWSDSMFNSWNKLQTNQNFNLSIDLFKVGILQKKEGKEKEHFILKIKKVLASL